MNSLFLKPVGVLVLVLLLTSFSVPSHALAQRPRRRVPTNSESAPTSQPVASRGFFFTPAVETFFAHVATNPLNRNELVARVLVRGGDIRSAQQLIPFCDYADDLRIAGLVAAYSPKPTDANARRIRGAAKLYSEDELAFGLASGLAMQGKYEQAEAIARGTRINESKIRGVILNHRPTKERVEEYWDEFPREKLYG